MIIYTTTKSLPNHPYISLTCPPPNVIFVGEGNPLHPVRGAHTCMAVGSPTRTEGWETYYSHIFK